MYKYTEDEIETHSSETRYPSREVACMVSDVAVVVARDVEVNIAHSAVGYTLVLLVTHFCAVSAVLPFQVCES